MEHSPPGSTESGIEIRGYLSQLGPMQLAARDLDAVEHNPFFCADPEALPQLEQFMDELRQYFILIGRKVYVES